MNREDIIHMAKDSGMELYGLGKDREKFVHYLQEFAALVIEAEQNRLARECAMLPFGDTAASFAVWIKNGGKA